MIILLDLDSTLIAKEGCNTLATRKGVGEKVAHITQETMDGVLDFDDAFPQKLELIAPSLEDLDTLGDYLLDYLSQTRKEVIADWQKLGYEVGILSQGYVRSSLGIAKTLNIDPERLFALEFKHHDDGSFAGLDFSQDLMYGDGKARVIRELRNTHPGKNIVLCGDSYGDLQSGQEADLFVAYTETIKRQAVIDAQPLIAECPHELNAHITKHFHSFD